jgi:hypothetical protein
MRKLERSRRLERGRSEGEDDIKMDLGIDTVWTGLMELGTETGDRFLRTICWNLGSVQGD